MIETDTAGSTKYLQYMCILPLVTSDIVGSLRGDKDTILARFEHESVYWAYGKILVSLGQRPVHLVNETIAFQQSIDPPRPKPIPPPFPDHSADLYKGKLTYCTWNSLQPPTPTTATSIVKALESFPLTPNNVLIDDGWQTVENRQLAAYGAQASWLDGFASLGAVISHVKKMGVERVGIWHTVLGYWGGFSRSSETFQNVPFLTLRKNWGAVYPIVHPYQVHGFFETWYRQLSEWGVDFVKCDDMAEIEDMDSCVDDEGNSFPLHMVRAAYVEAIRRNVERFFAGRIIWCMAQSPRHLVGPHALSTSSDIKPLRSSNDYFPDRPASHAYHVYTNILASQFLSGFTIADFDMFQTHQLIGSSTAPKQGPFHASVRALGNGPITVTDVPGQSDASVYKRVCGRARDGKTVALNGDAPVQVSDDRCFDEVAQGEDGRGLRGYSKSEWGVIMGLWNVRDNGGWVRDTLSFEDVVAAGFGAAKRIACWSHSRWDVMVLPAEPQDIVLKELEFDVFTMVEMGKGIACLGLIDKFNTLAAIHSCEGNIWNFKCLGEALWAIDGRHVAKVKIEGQVISCICWMVDGVTFVRASLTDYKEIVQDMDQCYWQVELSY